MHLGFRRRALALGFAIVLMAFFGCGREAASLPSDAGTGGESNSSSDASADALDARGDSFYDDASATCTVPAACIGPAANNGGYCPPGYPSFFDCPDGLPPACCVRTTLTGRPGRMAICCAADATALDSGMDADVLDSGPTCPESLATYCAQPMPGTMCDPTWAAAQARFASLCMPPRNVALVLCGGYDGLYLGGVDTGVLEYFDPMTGMLVAVVNLGISGSNLCLGGPPDFPVPDFPSCTSIQGCPIPDAGADASGE